MLSAPPVNPAASFEEALERIAQLQALDGPEILPQARTALLHYGAQTSLAVVLLHGFTNHPGQYREFAPLVHARGANVLIPRMPEHGDRDRLTARLAKLTAASLLERASQALDAAFGLGGRVCVAGISSSGLLCAYFAQHRADVFRSVVIAPEFAVLDLPYKASRAAAFGMRVLPDIFLWWDPRLKNKMHPLTAYPRFPTHALAQTLLIADDVHAACRREPFAAQSIHVLVNRRDPAVNNRVTKEVLAQWNLRRPGAEIFEFTTLPKNHDIVDPDNPNARTPEVYPALLEAIFRDVS